jgi:ACS family glucarate transporter-like MFS transporter
MGLLFVGAHCILGALLFLFVMGPIERVRKDPTDAALEKNVAFKAGHPLSR